ncbi:hypothetical protein ACFRAE_08535 [Sphingobacterium sp. HJSM2_6]|uniref:hypothetical protein n=1 Tax=Sphingobacterium sp. HJSM2_6 TaxID=3366264 RepID=UPI003BD48DDE
MHIAVFGQTTISGKLVDDQNKPISNVSVSYKKAGGTVLLGYGRSDKNGQYSLSVKVDAVDSIQLDFQHMNYAKKSIVVANRSASYSYQLKQQVHQIEEIKGLNIPISKRKDTINYDVNSFTNKQDRVIADIIKKLPGIEMQGDKILYQGRPIQKYMVNKLDLMEGRYGIINNNLPADAVLKVQIIENDQPIKILDSLVFSDRASINLELKRFTSTGTGKVGTGAGPFLWDVNLTPMTFGKSFQMLNSLQGNNTGNDVAKDLRAYYTGGNFLNNNPEIGDGPNYITLRSVSTPGFAQNKWLDNQIFLASTNVLQKLKDGLEIKGNGSYYNDLRKVSGITATEIFTSDQTILTKEAIDNRYRYKVLDAGILIEKNVNEVYLRNSLQFHNRRNAEMGNLLFNDCEQIVQNKKYEDRAIVNGFSMARFIGKQLVNVTSTIKWRQTPQQLLVIPGQMVDILNQGKPFDQMMQDIRYQGLETINGLSFMRKINYFTFSPSLQINYENRKLETGINIKEQSREQQMGEGYQNDLMTGQVQFSLGSRISWMKSKWKLSLMTPFSFYMYNVSQQQVQALSREKRYTFNPSLNAEYKLNEYNSLSANGSTGKTIGGLNNFYNAYIIDSYRSIQRYHARLLENTSSRAGLNYHYKNIIKANFGHMGYAYFEGRRDYIFRNTIDSLGQSTSGIEDRESRNSNHSVFGGIGRFFLPIKTVLKINVTANTSKSDYLLNDELAKQESRGIGGSLELINNLSSVLYGEYKGTFGHQQNDLAGGHRNRVNYNNHFLNITVYPHERHSFMFYNSLYINNVSSQRKQYFLDAMYRYRLEKWKTDIELYATNILNNNQYLQQSFNSYQLVQSYFELRPRQFIISTRFKF